MDVNPTIPISSQSLLERLIFFIFHKTMGNKTSAATDIRIAEMKMGGKKVRYFTITTFRPHIVTTADRTR
jgi:hypothetical protein